MYFFYVDRRVIPRLRRTFTLFYAHSIPIVQVVGLEELTPECWEQLCPLLPRQASTGRPAVEHRLIVEGIVWVIRTGPSWRDLPARFGPWQTVASRYQCWRKGGRWARILQVLQRPAVPITSSA